MSICLYKVDSRTYNTTLVADGIGIQFDAGSVFMNVLPYVIPDGSYRQVDVLSVLQYASGVEIGYINNDVFKKFKTSKAPNDIMSEITDKGLRPLFIGTRPLSVQDKRAMQYVYVFPKGVLNVNIINALFGGSF